MKKYKDIGIGIPEILLPNKSIDMSKWAVIACDQYTSEPEYWKKVETFTKDSPSTLHITYPEVYLDNEDKTTRIHSIQENMNNYLNNNIFDNFEGIIYVERKMKNGKTRHGIIMALDLEKYDYNKGSQTLIRATEGTIIDRLPPRIAIREGAPIELPHIMVLIDDPKLSIIEPLTNQKEKFNQVYNFNLMLDGGHIEGHLVDEENTEKIISGLHQLANPTEFKSKYQLDKDYSPLVFAMGDGNHSLATAKAIWEKNKENYGLEHPSRYALVEIVNIHDDALEFEPIHRVLFGVKEDINETMKEFFGDNFSSESVADMNILKNRLATSIEQSFGIISSAGLSIGEVKNPKNNLSVGTLQSFLDFLIEKGLAEKIDYVHGEESVNRLGKEEKNIGFYLPVMKKNDFFKTVILDGALPRKTFSMGEADEKRFYIECRRII